MNVRVGTVVACVLAMVLVAPAACAQTFTLVEDGQARAKVVLRDDPTDVELLARDELIGYVERATGARLPTDGDAPGVVELDVAPAEGTRIGWDVTPRRLRLTGSSPIALLMGTYRLLQEHVGCRWYVPGEIGEVVPEVATVTAPVGTRVAKPDWDVRTFFLRGDEGQWWALRNGINGWFKRDFLDALGTGVGDDLVWKQPDLGGFHAFFRILPPEQYRDEHPEYYALVNGRRVQGDIHTGQICTTNEEVLNIIARGAREWFEADPDARFYSVAPNDGYDWCTCDECMALEERLGGPRQWLEGDRLILSDRQVQFANEIARRALEGLPGRELIIFAYVNHAPPPQQIHPIEGVTVWLCHYTPACYAHTISDPDCPPNAEFFEYVKGWARWADRMGYYAYTNKSMWGGLPRPVTRPMMQDIRTLYDLGWRRYVAQSNARGFGQGGPLYWMTARFLWDVDADIDALLDDYFANMYGPAADEMAAYRATLEQAMLEPPVHFAAGPFANGPEAFSREEIAAARAHIEAALAEAENERVRERIEARLSSLDDGEVKLRYGWAMQEYEQTGDREVLDEAVEAARQIAEQGGRIGRRFQAELESLQMLAERGLMLTGMSAPVEMGGRTAWNSDETGPGDQKAGWMTIEVPRADHSKPHILELSVWGESAGFTPVIASEGGGVGYVQGGVWTPLERIDGSVPDDQQWHRVRWRVEPEQFDPELTGARIGFGGGDSQIWITDPRFYPVGE